MASYYGPALAMNAMTNAVGSMFKGMAEGEQDVRARETEGLKNQLLQGQIADQPLRRQVLEAQVAEANAPRLFQHGQTVGTFDKRTGQMQGSQQLPLSEDLAASRALHVAQARALEETARNRLEMQRAWATKPPKTPEEHIAFAREWAPRLDPEHLSKMLLEQTKAEHRPQREGERRAEEIHSYLRNVRGLTPGTAQYETEFMNWRNRPMTIMPGGAVFPMTDINSPSPTPATPGGAPQPIVQRPAAPNPGEREDLANLDAAELQLQTVIASLRKTAGAGGLGDVMGGVLKNPQGARKRLTEEYLGYGMTDEQRRQMGTMAIQLQAAKHALIGATRTRPELADVAAAIPDEKSLLRGDSAEQVLAKLEATLNDLRTKRAAREHAMRSSGISAPPPLAGRPDRANLTQPPRVPLGAEALSRRDPLYQKARSKGLTDQQIEQQYGVRVTD